MESNQKPNEEIFLSYHQLLKNEQPSFWNINFFELINNNNINISNKDQLIKTKSEELLDKIIKTDEFLQENEEQKKLYEELQNKSSKNHKDSLKFIKELLLVSYDINQFPNKVATFQNLIKKTLVLGDEGKEKELTDYFTKEGNLFYQGVDNNKKKTVVQLHLQFLLQYYFANDENQKKLKEEYVNR